MKNKKQLIYLSISKLAKSFEIFSVTEFLIDQGYDIYYYSHSPYDITIIDSARILVVIPPNDSKIIDYKDVFKQILVGMGNYNESKYASEKGIPIFIYNKEDRMFYTIIESKVVDPKDFQHGYKLIIKSFINITNLKENLK